MEIASVSNELVVGDHSLSGVKQGVSDNLANTGVVRALNRDVTLNALRNRDVHRYRDDLFKRHVNMNLERSGHRDLHLVRLRHGALHNDLIWCIDRDIDRNIVWNIDLTGHLHLTLDDHFAWDWHRNVSRDGDVTNLPNWNRNRHINRDVNENLPLNSVDDWYIANDGLLLNLGNLYVLDLLDVAFLDLRNFHDLFDRLHDRNFPDDLLDLMLDHMLNSFLDLHLRDFDYAFDGLNLRHFDNALLIFDARNFNNTLLDLNLRDVADDLLRLDLRDLHDALLVLNLRDFYNFLLDHWNVTVDNTLLHNGFHGDRLDLGHGKVRNSM